MNDEQIAPFTACPMGLPDLRIISIVAGDLSAHRHGIMQLRGCMVAENGGDTFRSVRQIFPAR